MILYLGPSLALSGVHSNQELGPTDVSNLSENMNEEVE
jgi:hypothetical protein